MAQPSRVVDRIADLTASQSATSAPVCPTVAPQVCNMNNTSNDAKEGPTGGIAQPVPALLGGDTSPRTSLYNGYGSEDCDVGDKQHALPSFLRHIQYPAPPPLEEGDRLGIQCSGGTDLDDSVHDMPDPDFPPKGYGSPMETEKFQNAQFNQYNNWPFPAMEVNHDLALIYDTVRSAGVPNYKGARIHLPSPLHPRVWDLEATGHEDDGWLSDCVC